MTENVNLCDLFATLCDFTGVPTPDGLDSRSLVPLCRGDSSGWSGESVSQFGGTELDDQAGRPEIPVLRSRHGRKYCSTLARDPQERVNLIEDPEYADVCQRFRYRCWGTGVRSRRASELCQCRLHVGSRTVAILFLDFPAAASFTVNIQMLVDPTCHSEATRGSE